jgi:hypothetical protein
MQNCIKGNTVMHYPPVFYLRIITLLNLKNGFVGECKTSCCLQSGPISSLYEISDLQLF